MDLRQLSVAVVGRFLSNESVGDSGEFSGEALHLIPNVGHLLLVPLCLLPEAHCLCKVLSSLCLGLGLGNLELTVEIPPPFVLLNDLAEEILSRWNDYVCPFFRATSSLFSSFRIGVHISSLLLSIPLKLACQLRIIGM